MDRGARIHPARVLMGRRYTSWSGNPVGAFEDSRLCVAHVTSRCTGRVGMQCALPRGHGATGEFCHRHALKLAAGEQVAVPEGARLTY